MLYPPELDCEAYCYHLNKVLDNLKLEACCYEAFLKLDALISGTGRRFFIERK